MSAPVSDRTGAMAGRLREVLGEPLSTGLCQLSSGASRETFRFATAGRGELVLQVDRGAKVGAGPPPQAALLAAAADAGVPVSRVVAHGGEDVALGAGWTVVEALAGAAEPGAILAGEGVPEPAQLIDQVAAALAAVHRMPADESLAPAVQDPIG